MIRILATGVDVLVLSRSVLQRKPEREKEKRGRSPVIVFLDHRQSAHREEDDRSRR